MASGASCIAISKIRTAILSCCRCRARWRPSSRPTRGPCTWPRPRGRACLRRRPPRVGRSGAGLPRPPCCAVSVSNRATRQRSYEDVLLALLPVLGVGQLSIGVLVQRHGRQAVAWLEDLRPDGLLAHLELRVDVRHGLRSNKVSAAAVSIHRPEYVRCPGLGAAAADDARL